MYLPLGLNLKFRPDRSLGAPSKPVPVASCPTALYGFAVGVGVETGTGVGVTGNALRTFAWKTVEWELWE